MCIMEISIKSHNVLNKIDVGIYVGYSDSFNGYNYNNKNVYGSELNIINLSECLAKNGYTVCVFVWNLQRLGEEIYTNGVYYLDAIKILNVKIPIDIMIINRYVHYFDYFPMAKPRKTLLWVQDNKINYFKDDKMLSYDRGITYCNNNFSKVDHVICLSEWHKIYLETCSIDNNFYDFTQCSLTVIGNAHNDSKTCNDIDKIKKNSFIFVSNPNRGLITLAKCLKLIQQQIPDCSLTVFRKNEIDSETLQNLSLINNVTLYGKVPNSIIKEHMLRADIFLYPTDFEETYCNSALEAQLCNTVCIYTDVGALSTTISDRGLKLEKVIGDNNFIEYTVDKTVNLLKNTSIKELYRQKGYDWAQNQTWYNRTVEWIKLF